MSGMAYGQVLRQKLGCQLTETQGVYAIYGQSTGNHWQSTGNLRAITGNLRAITGNLRATIHCGRRMHCGRNCGRGPDADRTMEFKETDADRTRTGRGRGRFPQRGKE
eukprot:gene7372-biopygen19548